MKRDQKFLSKLENELVKNKIKNRKEILLEYKNIIENRKSNKEKISDILKDFDSPENIVFNIKNQKKTKKVNFKIKVFFSDLFKKIKKSFSKIKSKFLVKKNRKVIDEIKEDVSYEKDIKEITVDNNNSINKKYSFLKGFLLTVLLILMSLFFILFISCCFAVLDGVKVYGIVISIFGILLLFLWFALLLYYSIIGNKLKRAINIIFVILVILLVSFGISLSIRYYLNIEHVYDVSEKYSMSTKIDSFNIPVGNRKLYIDFNSNYNTKYVIEYDNKLDSSIKIETKYYEAYYDYFVKKTSNNIYISLKGNPRDRFSVYINDLKENKIFDNKEFSRYTVRIIMNENDKDRVVIN